MNTKEVGKTFIEHFGVRGMKWGVRRSPAQLGRSGKKEGGEKEKPVVGKTKTEREGGAGRMSDATLKRVNSRLQMEQQYSKLTAKPPGFMASAKKFAEDIALNVAKQQLTNLANEQASKQIKSMMGKKTPKLPEHLIPRFAPPSTPRLG